MKIKTREMPYEQVMALPRPRHKNPMKPLGLLGAAIRLLSLPTLWKTRFTFTQERMEMAGDKPCLILMNHSAFMDLKIAYRIFFPRKFCIVGTVDSQVGKNWLMRLLGIIPTQKFVSDLTLIRDMHYALHQLKTSVLMFPEAGYSLDGRATVLPRHLGAVLKRMKVPVVTVTTYGAFARDPLYNGLQIRRVPVNAHVRCLATPEEIEEKTIDELDALIDGAFDFDQFAWQRDEKIRIREKFRADGLHRVLYKCAHCGAEGCMEGKGIHLTCLHCGKQYELDEYGQLRAFAGKTEFAHIPDWFDWQREQVRLQVQDGTYMLDTPVDIGMLVDHKALYMVGEGRLQHDAAGFVLTGCNGKLQYEQSNLASHSLNVDYFWYEKGDVISIGDKNGLFYCFPKDHTQVTKARLAAEEMYKLQRGAKK